MKLEFPYQIVTFLGDEPNVNEPVYNGKNGWYPQIALKRRFKIEGISEGDLINELRIFFEGMIGFDIETGWVVKPEHMPVRVIDIPDQDELFILHSQFIKQFRDKIISRYPDREGDNYYAHVTAECNGETVISVDNYTNKSFTLNNVWLLKDVADENSLAFSKLK